MQLQTTEKEAYRKTSDRSPRLLSVQMNHTPSLYAGPGVYPGPGFYPKFYGSLYVSSVKHVGLE